MKLTHVGRKIITKLDNTKYNHLAHFMKPSGLWISVNNDWERWCEDNQPNWIGKGRFHHKIKLKEDVNLFVIDTKEMLLDMFDELTKDILLNKFQNRSIYSKFIYLSKIFHEKISQNYDGIFLTGKVFWKHRLDDDGFYFYPWDCESICLWNIDKVESIEFIKEGEEIVENEM